MEKKKGDSKSGRKSAKGKKSGTTPAPKGALPKDVPAGSNIHSHRLVSIVKTRQEDDKFII